MIRKEGYEWLVKVTGVCVWVRMGVYGCNAVGEDKKQARKDKHGSNVHDFPATMAGKFLKSSLAWISCSDMLQLKGTTLAFEDSTFYL